MEPITTLSENYNTYNMDDFHEVSKLNTRDLNNKLFCTFTSEPELDDLLHKIQSSYDVMYKKIFILEIKENEEFVCTYNIDQGNVNGLPDNTIMVHRKKETNTLYTINALNELIKKLNGGIVDTSFRVEWPHYRNSILLTQHNELKQLKTKIFKILDI